MSKLRQHHWLVAGNVHYTQPANADQTHRSISFNTLLITKQQHINRHDLARAQQAMMQRFVTETEDGKTGQIVDVFIIAINHLGVMSEQEFHKGFHEKDHAGHQI